MAHYPYPANKENNTLFHSVIASSSVPAASAALNPLAQSQSSHYHRPLPPSPTKTTATAVVNPYGRPHHLAQSMTAATTARQSPGYSSDPTVAQLLAAQGNAHAAAAFQYPHPNQLRDSTMANATGIVSWRKGQGFKEWEKAKLDSQEVKRKADVAQLCQSACVSLGECVRRRTDQRPPEICPP